MPDSIHALIAARLDALTSAQRSLLQDAAVVGDHFWSGAVAAMNERDVPVGDELRELQRRGMIRRSSTQTIEGEEELSFSHSLMRDVAYKQIPRAGRVQRHLAVARWLEQTAGDRLEDRAEPLALPHDRGALVGPGRPPARGHDRAAGRGSAIPADGGEAADLARRRTSVRVLRARVGAHTERPPRPLDGSSATRPGSDGDPASSVSTRRSPRTKRPSISRVTNGDRESAALALRRLYFQLGFRGDTDAARAALDRGIELLEGQEPSPVLAELYAALAEDEMLGGRSEESLHWATRVLELPHSDTTAVMTLHIRGNGRLELGDLGGMDDLWEALRLAETTGTVLDQATSYSYLSEWVGVTEGPARGLELNDASIEICDRRGIQGRAMWARAESLWLLYDAGRWEDLLEVAAMLLPWTVEHGDSIARLGRPQLPGACACPPRLARRAPGRSWSATIPIARQVGDLQVQAPAFVAAAVAEHALGDEARALEHVREFEEATRDGPTEYRELQSPEIMRVCLANGAVELAAQVLGDRPVHVARTQHAVLASKAALAEARMIPRTAAGLFARGGGGLGVVRRPLRARACPAKDRPVASNGSDGSKEGSDAAPRGEGTVREDSRSPKTVSPQGISWRWRDSNPRPWATDWVFSGRSRW